MSEEQRNEETEVEGHTHGDRHANDEPRDEAETNDEVEGHGHRHEASAARVER